MITKNIHFIFYSRKLFSIQGKRRKKCTEKLSSLKDLEDLGSKFDSDTQFSANAQPLDGLFSNG